MRRLLIWRLGYGLLVALVAASATFGLLLLAPGDPMAAVLDHSTVDEATRDQWRAQWKLDRPAPERLGAWLRGLATWDLGPSITTGQSVEASIAAALPYSVLLMGSAVALSAWCGFLIALWQARRSGRWTDRVFGAATLIAAATPEAGIALLFLGVGAVSLQWFPAGGAHATGGAALPWLWWLRDLGHHLVLPLLTLTIGGTAVVARHQRASLAAVAPEDFVLLWRARGVPETRLWMRLVARHALASLVALLGLALPALVGGAVLVERIFAWPGMGTLIANGVSRRDAPLVASCVALSAVLVVLGSLGADAVHRWLDPRVDDADV